MRAPDHLLDKPYLGPIYDEPEFVVRNIWRLFGGWYDGDPSHLKPAPAASFAAEIASLAGRGRASRANGPENLPSPANSGSGRTTRGAGHAGRT